MDTNEAALRRGMDAAPHDATPRLVLADWLDDAGRGAEAVAHRIIGDNDPGPIETARRSGYPLREIAGHLSGEALEASMLAVEHSSKNAPMMRPAHIAGTPADDEGLDLRAGSNHRLRGITNHSHEAFWGRNDPAISASRHLGAAVNHRILADDHYEAADLQRFRPGSWDEHKAGVAHHKEGEAYHSRAALIHEAANLVHGAADRDANRTEGR